MATKSRVLCEEFILYVAFYACIACGQDTQIPLETPDVCETKGLNFYYDISQLRCRECAQTSLETSDDGVRCQCKNGMKIVQDFGGTDIQCEECPDGQVTGQNPWECVACSPIVNDLCPCPENTITVDRALDGAWPSFERELNGSWSNETTPGLNETMPIVTEQTRQCQLCAEETAPNPDGTRCIRCDQILSVLPDQTDCKCPQKLQVGGLCFETELDLDFDVIFSVNMGGESFDSAWLKNHLKAASAICAEKYNNITACQVLGNMCTMILYNPDPGQNLNGNACKQYKVRWERRSNGDTSPMPWLMYEESSTDILTDTGITQIFTFPDTTLNFQVAKYLYNGTYLGLSGVTNGVLQLCKNSEDYMNAAYTFGTQYSQSCSVKIQDLYDMDTIFYDMFIQFGDDGNKQLYAIPVRVLNYDDANEDDDSSQWTLHRRFFLVDSILGRQSNTETEDDPSKDPGLYLPAKYVRYAKSVTITIQLQDDETEGKIYPPYLTIDYDEAEGNGDDETVTVEFHVEYLMNIDKYNNDIAIAVGVLSALAIVYSVIQTWCWNKRAGQLAVDFLTLIKFVIFFCGNLANVFFVVTFGSALWWWIFYKRQNTVVWILPSKDQENQFVAFLGSAFAMKALQLIGLIFTQVTVDIFFVDWERPRGKIVPSNDAAQKGQDSPVSIWRTYFVANEWNELQTLRKINQIFQVFAVIFFLHVVGFENLATNDPLSEFSFTTGQYRSPDSRILRYAIGSLAYLLIAISQWIFYTFIYERFIEDKVRQYVDLCSMSNVSVFIMENKLFGHYIHGRSVHGRADTGVREMAENMKREEEDLCGKRGLIPNTEQQTFKMALPRKLRSQYDKVMMPITMPPQGPQNTGRGVGTGGGSGTGNIDSHTDRCVQSYSIINRFMQAFLDHSLKDIDYFVKDKNLLENVMDVEFQDTTQKGHFYNDSGHGFDQVLFFGHEMTLTIFEILFFSIVDLIGQNFVLAAVLTYIMGEALVMIRDNLGRNNLAKKTLVDKRFLI